MINSAVSGEKRLRSEVRYRNESSYSAYTGLVMRPTLMYNGNQSHWQHIGLKVTHCDCWPLSVCIHLPSICHFCGKPTDSWVAAETNPSSSFACPVGNTEGGAAFVQRWNKELCMPRPEQPLVIVWVMSQQSEPLHCLDAVICAYCFTWTQYCCSLLIGR